MNPIRSTAVVAAVLATAACGATATPSPVTPGSASAPASPTPPRPTFADLTRGDAVSAVKLYAYDPAARSAVVEPIVFMDGPAFCRKFRIKAGDPRCEREWTTEESHTRVTVPVSARPRLTVWENDAGDDCIGSPVTGATCAVPASTFSRRVKANPRGFAVITIRDGVAVKLAELYTP